MMQRVPRDLSAMFGSTGRPVISMSVLWCCTALACPLATRGGYAGAVGAAFVISLSVLFLAYLLASGALAFAGDAKRSLLPRSQRLSRRASLLASVLLLPAIALSVVALAGNPVWRSWVSVALVFACAFAGVLAPPRPASAVGLLLITVLAACLAANGHMQPKQGKEWLLVLVVPALILLAAATPLLAAIEWRRVIGRSLGFQVLAERFRDICTRIDQPTAFRRAPGMAASRQRSWERTPPVRIIRTCLGGMFGQLSRRLIVVAMLLSLFVVAAMGLPWLGAGGERWAILGLALVAGGLVSSGYLAQLPNLTRGQIAELALIPGLGAPAAQRRALCCATLTPPLGPLGLVLVFGSADLLLKGEPLSSIGTLAACLFVLWLAYIVFALQKLATLPPRRQSLISELLLLYLVVYASGAYFSVYAMHPQFHLWFWFWITPLLLSVGIMSAIGHSLRRLATAPHPFLAQ